MRNIKMAKNWELLNAHMEELLGPRVPASIQSHQTIREHIEVPHVPSVIENVDLVLDEAFQYQKEALKFLGDTALRPGLRG